MRFYYCRGSDKKAPNVARFANVSYGIRGDCVAYDRALMIDFDFHSEPTPKKWSKFLGVIQDHKPDMALIPDFFANVSPSVMLSQIEDVKRAGAYRVAVCPKFTDAVKWIPKDCIIAISIPTTYAGFMPDYSELVGRDLHLLGGHPDAQSLAIHYRYSGLNIISADGNISGYKAELGQYWSHKQSKWVDVRHQYSSFSLNVLSIRNTIKTLEYGSGHYRSKRNKSVLQLALL